MGSFLILYGTGEGQTAKVSTRLADAIKSRGHDVTTRDVEDVSEGFSVSEFDAVLVGSSIHAGRHHRGIRTFITEHRADLQNRPTALFQVSLSSAEEDPERRAEAASYVDDLLEETDWSPDRIGLFGGALRYSKYGFLKRLVMKQIAGRKKGNVDTSRDYEYTDWEEVSAFGNDFVAFVEGRLGLTSATATSEEQHEDRPR